MKRFLLLVAGLLLPILHAHAADTYTMDPNHSYVQWRISHFDFSFPSGKWFANGTINMDPHHPKDDKVEVNIKLDELVTGIPKLDKHLKGSEFFEVDKFPTATFVSDKVDMKGNMPSKVHGTLTVHGISKPITLDITHSKKGISPITNKETVGFGAKATLKRSDFGITTLLPGLGDEVNLIIEAEAAKAESGGSKPVAQ